MFKRFNQIDQFEFHHALARARGKAIVFFTSDSCASCRYWQRLLADYANRRLDVRVFEVDAKKESALAEEFEVQHLPALFLYVDGVFHCALQTEASISKLGAAIAAALAAPPQEMP